MKISVVIPTHNRSDALAKTLAHLSKQQFDESWEVIVVNNRCTDDTDEVVRRQPFPVALRLIHQTIPGVGAARNAGAAASAGEYIAFLDNDILVEPDFLRRHCNALQANPGCWVLGQVVNLPEQERTPFGQYRKSLYGYLPPENGIGEAHWLTGQIFSLPRTDFERLDWFDETFGGASVEDYDLAIRAWDAGIKILFHPEIVAIHNDWAGFSIQDYCRRQMLYTRAEPRCAPDVVPNIVAQLFSGVAPVKRPRSKGTVQMLFVGSIHDYRKGMDVLLPALKAYLDMTCARSCHLSVIGDGGKRAEFESLSHSLGIQDCCSLSREPVPHGSV